MAVLDPTKRRGEPTRRSWKIIGFSTLVALVAFGAVQPAPVEARGAAVVLPEPPTPAPLPNETVVMPAAPRRESRAEHQGQGNEEIVRVSPGERLDLDLDAGGSVTIRSWDENRVSVRCRLSGESWRDIATSVERVDGGVLVRARYTRRSNYQSSNNEFEIRVPRQFDVRIASAGGSLTIIGVEGRFTGHTGGGGFILDDLRGSASLTTGGGEIRVSDSNLSGRVSTGGGTVMLSRVSGGLRGSSGSGPVIYGESGEARRSTTTANGVTTTTDLRSVDVRDGGSRIDIGRNSAYRSGTLNITKAGGDIELNAAPNGAFVHTGGGDVRVGEAGGDVDAGTGGGNVTVGPASGSVRAGTGAGEVRIIVDRVTRGQVIEASSGFGRVIIELPRDFEGTFDLETAHTESHERTARIRSDWSLDEQPLTGWDDRQGTPRRYLRATKQVGSGGARVIVRTVNGEIEVRRR